MDSIWPGNQQQEFEIHNNQNLVSVCYYAPLVFTELTPKER